MPVPSLHNDRLRTVAIGYYFDVITNGINRMYSYANRIPAEDRWAVAAYVRALQLSQNANADDLNPEERQQLP
jgi:mono/diheme cytochrome c family protein